MPSLTSVDERPPPIRHAGPMATLICSQGHPNPVGQRFCGECGEDLTTSGPAPEPDGGRTGAAAGASPRLSTSTRYTLVAFALAVVFAFVAVAALLVGPRHSSPSAPSATTVARGNAVLVWYFPATTPETDLVDRVDAECAAHPEVGAIQVHFIDLDVGNLATSESRTYPCS